MSDEKVIIDLCSSDEEEDNFADQNRFEEDLDLTEEADASSRYFPNGSFAYFNLSFLISLSIVVVVCSVRKIAIGTTMILPPTQMWSTT